jgi:hypothetical protein
MNFVINDEPTKINDTTKSLLYLIYNYKYMAIPIRNTINDMPLKAVRGDVQNQKWLE